MKFTEKDIRFLMNKTIIFLTFGRSKNMILNLSRFFLFLVAVCL